jgi:hypothetical protein
MLPENTGIQLPSDATPYPDDWNPKVLALSLYMLYTHTSTVSICF